MTGAKGKIVTSLSSDSVRHGKLLCEECGKNCPSTYETLVFSESRFSPESYAVVFYIDSVVRIFSDNCIRKLCRTK